MDGWREGGSEEAREECKREDIAELANVLAWDAVGAQIEPYLVQHAKWQRPCGVALGCRSLNSRGIKMLRRAAVFNAATSTLPDANLRRSFATKTIG